MTDREGVLAVGGGVGPGVQVIGGDARPRGAGLVAVEAADGGLHPRWSRTARRAGICAAIGVLALAFRLPALDVFLTADETRWTCRSANFWHALEAGRLADTYQKEHPGVITMWLGGLGLPRDAASDWATACREVPASKLVEETPEPALDVIVGRLFQGRARVALATGLGVAAMVWLAAGLLGIGPAVLGGLLLAADPFLIAHGRVLHLDGVTTTLMTLALLSLLTWLHRGRRGRYLLLAGALAGLGAVNKSPALFMAPMAGLLLLVDAVRGRAGPREARGAALARALGGIVLNVARPLGLFGLAAAAAYVAAWPAMWAGPVATLQQVLGGATEYAELGHEGGNYFVGLPVPDPGPLFYPVAWAMRTTPIGLAGLVVALVLLARPGVVGRAIPSVVEDDALWAERGPRRRGDAMSRERPDAQRTVLLSLLAYAVIFGLGMTFGAKKFDRYLLPAFPALDLVAGWGLAMGLWWLARRGARTALGAHGGEGRGPSLAGGGVGGGSSNGAGVDRRAGVQRAIAVGGAALVAVAALVGAWRHAPYYLDAFNPLFGGIQRAPGRILVGWGEGLDRAAAWLNALPDAEGLQVATRYRSAFGPLFRGQALEMNKIDPATVDYYLFYQNQLQRDLDPELLARYRPGPYAPGATGYARGHPASAVARLPGPAPSPAHVVRLGGIDYAWLYESDTWRPVADLIAARGAPGEAIVVRGDSRFAAQYQGELPLVALEPDAGADDVQRLVAGALAEHDAVWWVRYDGLVPRPGLVRGDALLATSALGVDHAAFDEVAVTRFVGGAEAARLARGTGAPFRPAAVSYGDDLALTGYALTAEPAVWGRGLGVRLRWEARAAPRANLTAFVHLIGPDGRRVAQADRAIGDDDLVPTSRWPAGKTASDERVLTLPVGAPPGTYTLLIGVYDAATNERLAAVDADGAALDEGVFEVEVAVGRSPLGPEDASRALGGEPAGEIDDVALLAVQPTGPVEGGATVTLAVVWAVTATPEGNHRVDVTVRDALGQTAGLAEVDTVFGIPEADWRPGDVLRMHYDLLLDPRAAAGAGSIAFTDAAGHAVTAPLTITGPERRDSLPTDAGEATAWRFGDVAALRAVDVPERAAAGDALDLTLWWEALAEPQAAYSVFVHLVGPDGAIAAQADGEPAGGARRTTSWLAREVLGDPRALGLPEDLPPGDYAVLVGLYDPATGAKLPAVGAGGERAPDDRAPVATVRVR